MRGRHRVEQSRRPTRSKQAAYKTQCLAEKRSPADALPLSGRACSCATRYASCACSAARLRRARTAGAILACGQEARTRRAARTGQGVHDASHGRFLKDTLRTWAAAAGSRRLGKAPLGTPAVRTALHESQVHMQRHTHPPWSMQHMRHSLRSLFYTCNTHLGKVARTKTRTHENTHA